MDGDDVNQRNQNSSGRQTPLRMAPSPTECSTSNEHTRQVSRTRAHIQPAANTTRTTAKVCLSGACGKSGPTVARGTSGIR